MAVEKKAAEKKAADKAVAQERWEEADFDDEEGRVYVRERGGAALRREWRGHRELRGSAVEGAPGWNEGS